MREGGRKSANSYRPNASDRARWRGFSAMLPPMRRLLVLVIALTAFTALAEDVNPKYAPDRRADEGDGPYERLILRGATLVDGTGAPPIGPVDIVIEKNRIK